MTSPAFRIVPAGESRSFPKDDPFRAAAAEAADIVVILGRDAGAAFAEVAAGNPRLILVELGTKCLGEITGESKGEEGGNVVGFSRFRLGSGPASPLVELVVQPRTPEDAVETARTLFEEAGFKTAVCADRPGRIVDRLVRPYFNSALERLDDGLATADDLDRAVKLGLGFRRGPVEWLEETGLADHCEVSDALSDALRDPFMRPARRARIAANRKARP